MQLETFGLGLRKDIIRGHKIPNNFLKLNEVSIWKFTYSYQHIVFLILPLNGALKGKGKTTGCRIQSKVDTKLLICFHDFKI